MRTGARLIVTAGAVFAAATAAAAVAGTPVFPIPGVSATRIASAGAVRLDDGGAVVALTLAPRNAGGSQAVAIRLHLDGTVDLAYGQLGLSALRLGATASATALAADPSTGEAWIGVSVGPRRRGAIVDVAGHGSRRGRFGAHGLLWLGGGGPPTALAWRNGELLVAYGDRRCAGCLLEVLDPVTGARIARGATPPGSATPRPCAPGVSDAILTGPGAGLLAEHGGPGCPAQLSRLTATGRSLKTTALAGPGPPQTAYRLASFAGGLCLAASSRTSTRFGAYRAGAGAFAAARVPAGEVVSLVALGDSACAALVSERGSGRSVVAQASTARTRPTISVLPRSVRPLAMFRCHGHLLVIGARAQRRQSAGVIAAVAVTRGPYGSAPDQTAAVTAGSGCR